MKQRYRWLIVPLVFILTACSPLERELFRRINQKDHRVATVAIHLLGPERIISDAPVLTPAQFQVVEKWLATPTPSYREGDCDSFYHLAIQAGFQPYEWPTVKRLGRAESGCTNSATGPNGEIGWMQIHVRVWLSSNYGNLCSVGIACTRDQLRDPLINLRAAEYIQDSGGWGHWSTY